VFKTYLDTFYGSFVCVGVMLKDLSKEVDMLVEVCGIHSISSDKNFKRLFDSFNLVNYIDRY